MALRFCIEDEFHDEPMEGEFDSFETALAEVRRLAALPWGEPPNQAPCRGWTTCGRHYEIVEYDASIEGRLTERSRTPIVKVMSDGPKWQFHGGVQ